MERDSPAREDGLRLSHIAKVLLTEVRSVCAGVEPGSGGGGVQGAERLEVLA